MCAVSRRADYDHIALARIYESLVKCSIIVGVRTAKPNTFTILNADRVIITETQINGSRALVCGVIDRFGCYLVLT